MANDDAWASGWAAGQGKKKSPGESKARKFTQKALARQQAQKQPVGSEAAEPTSFKKGGVVRKTGYAKVHRGEKVLTAREAKSYRKKSSKRTHKKNITKR
jgi:lipopolysaccharide export system protein LptA